MMKKKDGFTIDYARMVKFIGAIAALVPECRLRIGNGQMSTIIVDTANVAMIDVTMKPDDCRGTVVLGIEINEMKTLLDAIGKISPVLEANPEIDVTWEKDKEPDTYVLHFTIPSIGYRASVHTINQAVLIRKDPNKPKIDLNATFECTGGRLMEAVSACARLGDAIRLRAIADGSMVYAELYGNDKIYHSLELAASDTVPAVSLYSIDYLRDITKIMKDAISPVTVRFDTDHPIKLQATLAEGIEVIYWLSPRMEPD